MGLVCSNMNGLSSEYCLPKKIQCTETDTDGFLQDCNKRYCDVRCDYETEGTIPFVIGDKIMFQTQFRDKANTDIKAPTLGWGDWIYVEIYDGETGEMLPVDINSDFYSRYYVCHNGRNSYQVIEVDTGADEFPCSFYLKFISFDGTGLEATQVDERCTHIFKQVDGCMETHLLQGVYSQFDCLGNYYGTPDCEDAQQTGAVVFPYENTTRIESKLVKQQPEADTEDDKTTVTDNYLFTTKYADNKHGVFLSNYMISWYLNLFSANVIKIDNVSKTISNFAINYDKQEPNSAIVDFEWKENCNECFG